MAKSTTPPAYEPEALYDVRLTGIVRVGRLRLLPINRHQIVGAALNAVVAEYGAEVIESATLAPEAGNADDPGAE